MRILNRQLVWDIALLGPLVVLAAAVFYVAVNTLSQ